MHNFFINNLRRMFESKFKQVCKLRDEQIQKLWADYCDDDVLLQVMKDEQSQE